MKQVIICSLILQCGLLLGQTSDNSPYSRFGLGDFAINQRVPSMGMGGLRATYSDQNNTNFENPASLGYLKSTVYEGGIFVKHKSQEAGGQTAKQWSGNLSYLSLAFPLKNPLSEALQKKPSVNHYALGINLTPVNSVNYDVKSVGFAPGVDSFTNEFTGKGAAHKVQLAGALQRNNWSVGASIGWLIGNFEARKQVRFTDLADSYITSTKDEYSLNGFSWQIGALYDHYLTKIDKKEPQAFRPKLSFGLTGHGTQSFRTNKSFLYSRINLDLISSTNNTIDTFAISPAFGLDGSGRLPAELVLGIMHYPSKNLKWGLDASYSNWESYRNDAKPDTSIVRFSNLLRFAAGLEYCPNPDDYKYYFKKIRYRFGVYFQQDPRVLNGNTLTDLGITFGAGLPIKLSRGQVSYVHWAVELGQFGNSNLIQEKYARLHFAFSFSDNSWFFKRKFD